jgi:hypothetical protein
MSPPASRVYCRTTRPSSNRYVYALEKFQRSEPIMSHHTARWVRSASNAMYVSTVVPRRTLFMLMFVNAYGLTLVDLETVPLVKVLEVVRL